MNKVILVKSNKLEKTYLYIGKHAEEEEKLIERMGGLRDDYTVIFNGECTIEMDFIISGGILNPPLFEII